MGHRTCVNLTSDKGNVSELRTGKWGATMTTVWSRIMALEGRTLAMVDDHPFTVARVGPDEVTVTPQSIHETNPWPDGRSPSPGVRYVLRLGNCG